METGQLALARFRFISILLACFATYLTRQIFRNIINVTTHIGGQSPFTPRGGNMCAQIFNVGAFVENELPKLIDKRGRFRAVATTYNTIEGYPDGKVATGDPNLQVKTIVGRLPPMSLGAWLSWGVAIDHDEPRARQIGDQQTALALEAQAGVATQLNKEKAPNFIVMYAGLRGFDNVMQTCKTLRQHFPKTYIAVLACDCDYREKERDFIRALNENSIDAGLFTGRCGGCSALSEILTALIERWPDREKPVPRKRKRAL